MYSKNIKWKSTALGALPTKEVVVLVWYKHDYHFATYSRPKEAWLLQEGSKLWLEPSDIEFWADIEPPSKL
jgi:hypothetical protein